MDAKREFQRYIGEGLIRKGFNKTAFEMYVRNSDLSFDVAEKLSKDDDLKPHLWVLVCSYYSMFYVANAVLLSFGYMTTGKLVHKVTSDSLRAIAFDKIKEELFEEYEEIMDEALEIASARAEEIVDGLEFERKKRSRFQYEMTQEIKEKMANTSLERAKRFRLEMKKLLKTGF